MDKSKPVDYPIDGILDLHTFEPSEVKDLVPGYITECIKNKIYLIRIIHGKGKGILRKTVHSLLRDSPSVHSFRTATEEEGGWGATIVRLKGK
jgi:DNA-nicking Smr family endonuclease